MSPHRPIALSLALLLLLTLPSLGGGQTAGPGAGNDLPLLLDDAGTAGSATGRPATLPVWYSDLLVVSGLNVPLSIAFLPGGQLLIAQQAGAIRLLENGSLRTLHAVAGVSTVGNERGLLGIAVDPSFPARPYAYVHYTATTVPTYIHISRFTFQNASGGGPLTIDGGSELVYIDDIPDAAFNHNGGTVKFGKDGYLYISIGDDADNCAAQDLTQLKGKVLRISVNASADPSNRSTLAPPDNPYAGAANVNQKLVWFWGLRNPFRIDPDPVTGRMLIGDVGQATWEEIDLGTAGGQNFGWPYFEGNAVYRSTLCPGQVAFPPMVAPLYVYRDSGGASVMGYMVYRGQDHGNDSTFPPEREGDLFFQDYYSGNMRVLHEDAANATWDIVDGVSAGIFASGMQWVPDMARGFEGAAYYPNGAGEIRRIVYQPAPRIVTSSLPTGRDGDPFDANLTGEWGAPPYTWGATGGAPAWLTIGLSTGRLTGTPNAAGTSNVTFSITDTAGRVGTRVLPLTVLPGPQPPSITTTALPNGTQGVPYSAPLAAENGTPPYTWDLSAGTLPPGLALNATSGAVTGTPTANGTWSPTVRVTDTTARAGTRPFSIRILAPPPSPVIITTSLPDATATTAYNAKVEATGGTPPYTWSLESGSLPAGLALDPANGTIAGTPTTAANASFVVRVTDTNAKNDTQTLLLRVAPYVPPVQPPTIITRSLPDGVNGTGYTTTVIAANGTAALRWSVAGGALPPVLALDPATGILAGNLTTAGGYTAVIRVTDAQDRSDERIFPILVAERVRRLEILTSSLTPGTIGHDYPALQIRVQSANTTDPLRWSATNLPSGMAFSGAGSLGGVPIESGEFVVRLAVRDSTIPAVTASIDLPLVITRIHIAPVTPPPGKSGTSYTLQFTLVDPPAAGAAWSVATGGLPPGVTLQPSGLLTGKPRAQGTYTFTVRAEETGVPLNADTATVAVVIEAGPKGGPGFFGSSAMLLAVVAIIAGAVGVAFLMWLRRRPPATPAGGTGTGDGSPLVTRPVEPPGGTG